MHTSVKIDGLTLFANMMSHTFRIESIWKQRVNIVMIHPITNIRVSISLTSKT